MIKTIITTKNRNHDIVSEDADVVQWFENTELTQTDTILEQLNVERLYDPVLASKTDLTILDIGANCGLFSLYAQDSAKKIIAVEPTPATLNILRKLTKGIDNITIAEVALSDSNGTIDFFVSDNPTINSIVNQVGEKVTVAARTIATLLEEQGLDWVDFVKCDIEGSELVAITEATLDPVKDRIGSWFIECHRTDGIDPATWPGNLEANRQRLISILRNAGYSAEPIIHDQIFAWK